MPIADCGFPPRSVESESEPGEVVTGSQMLVRKGPTALVEIGFSADLLGSSTSSVFVSGPDDDVKETTTQIGSQVLVEALIDTGARESCIDEALAQQLQLPLIDRGEASGADGKHEFNVYLGYIRMASLDVVEAGRFMGVRLADGDQPHQALLGRGLLKDMLLVYDGRDGTVRLAC